jgi:hypothetical protein
MKIRTTEREHLFTKKLFNKLRLFSIQGLTLDIEHNFTAGIEAIQYEVEEVIDLINIFPLQEVKAKYYLTKSLNIPLYFVVYQSNLFKVFKIEIEQEFSSNLMLEFKENDFIKWWAKLKGLYQPKPLMEAADRVKDSIFDIVLEKNGMAWGGNIDGFMFKNKNFACIIENIYTQKNPLNSPQGEPSYYFHMRGPNYNTWYPTVTLAQKLNIPLFLFTIEGNNNYERIGFAVIDYLSPQGIFYKGRKPNENIIVGIEEIERTIIENLAELPPKII